MNTQVLSPAVTSNRRPSNALLGSVFAEAEAVGVKCPSCTTCAYLGSDGDGPEYNGSWPVCNKIERYGYLRSFPFKKPMPCWSSDFWSSKFTDMIKKGTDAELKRAVEAYHAAAASALPNTN